MALPVGFAASLAAPAAAQPLAQIDASPLAPVAQPLFSDDAFSADHGGLPVGATFAPLRLSLVGGLFPQASTLPNCDSRADASGNSIHGFELQRSIYLRLAPNLILHGFSSTACPVDAGLGGGFTYATQLTKRLWLVSSLGLYTLPAIDEARSALVTASGRVDLVRRLGWGRTLNVGFGTRQRSGAEQFNAVSFGGSF